MRATPLNEFLPDLNGGVFQEQIENMLSLIASSVVDTGKKGKIQITLDLERISESNQVKVSHELKYVQPKKRGSITETDKSETPMHVNPGGKMSFFPENQGQLFGKKGEAPYHQQQEQ